MATETRADSLLKRAPIAPREVLAEGRSYLADLPEHAAGERAITLRALSIAARSVDPARAIRFGRESVAIATEAGLDSLRLESLLTLTGSMASAGQLAAAAELIDNEMDKVGDLSLRGDFLFQRGTMARAMGDHRMAESLLFSSLNIARRLNSPRDLAFAARNLALMWIDKGEIDEAMSLLTEALEAAEATSSLDLIEGILHNLGLACSRAGDLPAALEYLARSDDLHRRITGDEHPQHSARAEVMVFAGLFQEAFELASLIASGRSARSDVEHEADAVLIAAESALQMGDAEKTEELSARALDLLEAQSRKHDQIRARVVQVRGQALAGTADDQTLAAARELAAQLTGQGFVAEAAAALRVAADIADALGDTEIERAALSDLAEISSSRLDVQLAARWARSRLSELHGDRRAALAAARSGLDLIDRHQAAIGATDMRMGMERLGRDLVEVGLRLAGQSRHARRTLGWIERSRASALRHAPVVPPRDDEMRRLLAALRNVEAQLRSNPNQELLRRRGRLQQEVTARDRTLRGENRMLQRPSPDLVIEELGETTLLEYGRIGGDLVVVVVRRGRASYRELGPIGPIGDIFRRLRFDLKRAARLGRELDLMRLGELDGLLFRGIEPGSGDVIISPPAELMALPWSVLPTLEERAVNVTPSVEIWWRAKRQQPGTGRVVVAGGPDLDIAENEVSEVARLYDTPEVFVPEEAASEPVRDAMSGAGIAHIAAHARFEVQNPMFSSLRLADGDLNVYDLERIGDPPSTVVLSACDSGYTEARPGEELAGLTSALLSMGSRSIIASIGLVPDSEATKELMVALHRGLASGKPAAEALAAAQNDVRDTPAGLVSAASFIAVGA